MAYFDSNELVDYIRNTIHLDDDTGISCKILQKPRRREQNSNLLPYFKSTVSDLTFDDRRQDSPNYFPSLEENCLKSTLLKINLHLLKEFQNIKNNQICCNYKLHKEINYDKKNLFIAKEAQNLTFVNKTSLTSKLIVENKNLATDTVLEKYAKFEKIRNSPNSRTITIVFSMCKLKPCAIPITIIETATLSDLINLSCCVYTREKKSPPCEDPSLYSLYLADEDFEYDTELPPQDRHRLVSECGFSTLALVKNSNVFKEKFIVNIYFVNSDCIELELKSLDVLLQTVFDHAINYRKKKLINMLKEGHNEFRETDYILETLEHRNCPLKLSNTIASTGCTNFVLLRKNSYCSTILTKKSSFSNNFLENFNERLSQKNDQNCQNFPLLSQSSSGKILFSYTVHFLFRIKPKWPVCLLFCENGLEFVFAKRTTNWKTFLFKNDKKILRLLYNIIGSIEVGLTKKNSSQCIIEIIYLLAPEYYQFLFIDEMEKFNNQLSFDNTKLLMQALSISKWKTLQIKMFNKHAWELGTKLLEILDCRKYRVRQLFQHSFNGKKRPAESAKLALMN